jgi:SAM-dependent methyltransferase
MTGIDFAPAGLEIMRRMAPDLKSVLGSVDDMPFPRASYDGALSLGVVEHFEEGPERPIAELARVIRPGGTLFLTVPFHNLVADVNDYLGARNGDGHERTFYQYLFRRHEMAERLLVAGFDIHRVDYLGKALGLSELELFGHSNGNNGFDQPAAASPPQKNGDASPVHKLKTLLKAATPGLARSIREAQIRLVETVLPGRVCAHLIAFTASRRAS